MNLRKTNVTIQEENLEDLKEQTIICVTDIL